MLIFVFSFCFHDTYMIATFPIVNVALVCNLKPECTVNAVSKNNFRQLVLSAFNVRHNSCVPTGYLTSLSSLLQSP